MNSNSNNIWREYRLEEVVETFIDYRGKTPTKTAFGVPLVTAKIIKNGRLLQPNEFIDENYYKTWMTRGFPEKNDVLLTTEAPLGEVALLNNPKVALGQRVITIRGKKGFCDSIFLKYYFQSPLGQNSLLSRAQGSTVEGIKAAELKKMKILMPNYETQIELSRVLFVLDQKIDVLLEQNKTLEDLAETYFLKLFEAVSGENSGTLGDYIDLDPKEKINRNEEYRFFDMKTLSENSMSIANGLYRIVNSASSFRNLDTLLAKITPCLENGKTGFVMNLEDNEVARGSTEFIVMRSKGLVSPYWIYCLARSKNFRDEAIQSMTGTSGRQRVQTSQLKNIKVSFNKRDMESFNEMCKGFFNKVKENSSQVRTLITLRNLLLPKLMSTEIRLN
ncbi:MAG: restriction endonuclease subunit S [Patescibacteria group bacterium]